MNSFADLHLKSNIVAISSGIGSLEAYYFSQDELLALKLAVAARRPLLIRGEPGHPKREFAIAAAQVLRQGFIEVDVDENQEFDTLLWHYDPEQRQAEASIIGQLALDQGEVRQRLEKRLFITPGPIWWNLDHLSARSQAEMSVGIATIPIIPSQSDDLGFVLFIQGLDYADDRYLRRLASVFRRGYFDLPLGANHKEFGFTSRIDYKRNSATT